MGRPKGSKNKQTTATNTQEIGFEEKIWQAADRMRGHIDPSEYKNVVLGLIFLKYISDRFEQKHAELVAEGEGFEEDRDEYEADGIFWVPRDARWEAVASAAHTPEVGKVIDNAMRQIEAENDSLKGILPKNFARQELDKRMLGDVVDLFTNVKMASEGNTQDVLGRTYEYCLTKFAEKEGKNAGEFYTPTCIVRALVEIIQPYQGRVYDPCCGSGGMFVQSAQFVEHHSGSIRDISVFGQESNPTTWKMAKMNLAIRGIEADLGPHNAGTFFEDLHQDKRFDFVLANPPFNDSDWGGERLRDDPRWDYGVPPVGNANFAWMQHMIHHLNDHGRMGMVLANGSLSSQQSGEGDIRANIVKDDIVEGIVALPEKLFYSTGIPVCLWIIDKGKKARSEESGKVLFVDARELGTMVTRKLRELKDGDISKIAGAFDDFRKGSLEPEKGFCAVATLGEIERQDYILTPGRYVGIADEEDDDEPFDEKMKRLTSELSKCFEESDRLQEEIKKNLEAIGYGI
jgi:type I restriction enzyme M protein